MHVASAASDAGVKGMAKNSPYSPPHAEITSQSSERNGRSVGIWLVVLVMGGSSLFSCISLSMPILGWEISSSEDRRFFSGLSVIDWIVVFSPHLSFLIACYYIFRMKRQAVKIWAFSIGLTVLSTGNIALKQDIPATSGELWGQYCYPS